MKKATCTANYAGLNRIVQLAASMLFLTSLSQGIAADESYDPVSAGFETEISRQGASALHEMTRELRQDLNWQKLGIQELEATLQQQVITKCQAVNNIVQPNC
ncbi:MAG: hypothetical protein QNJ78_06080 [Gammaproteobacteria bacterium]|nr:hypothetical protein [Gammaproteobacteria bacterium]